MFLYFLHSWLVKRFMMHWSCTSDLNMSLISFIKSTKGRLAFRINLGWGQVNRINRQTAWFIFCISKSFQKRVQYSTFSLRTSRWRRNVTLKVIICQRQQKLMWRIKWGFLWVATDTKQACWQQNNFQKCKGILYGWYPLKDTKMRRKFQYKILLISFDSVQESGTLQGETLIQSNLILWEGRE